MKITAIETIRLGEFPNLLWCVYDPLRPHGARRHDDAHPADLR